MAIDVLREITTSKCWRAVAKSIAFHQRRLPASIDDFGTYWIEAGHRMREQISDDRLLCDLLRSTLPNYIGETITLYRGENLNRWRAGAMGFAWTRRIAVARMFARGPNAVRGGGVLLHGAFAPRSIISGPHVHSNHLQEAQFTIDPFLAEGVKPLETYPPL